MGTNKYCPKCGKRTEYRLWRKRFDPRTRKLISADVMEVCPSYTDTVSDRHYEHKVPLEEAQRVIDSYDGSFMSFLDKFFS